jgi:flavorubredoxin
LSELARVRPTERLRYVGLSHVEADECGALNDGLAIAQQAEPLCGSVAAMGVGEGSGRPRRVVLTGPLDNPGLSRFIIPACLPPPLLLLIY